MDKISVKEIAKKYGMDCQQVHRQLRQSGICKVSSEQKGKVIVGLYDSDAVEKEFSRLAAKRVSRAPKNKGPRFASFEESVLANRGAGLKAGAIAKRLKANIVDVWGVISKAAAFETTHSV